MRDNDAPRSVRLDDYRVPDFLVDRIDLQFDIREPHTRVTARLEIRRNPAGLAHAPLRLDGEGISLVRIELDGVELSAERYVLDAHSLTIPDVPDAFFLQTVGDIDPVANTALEGLYVSHGMYCTQCEAEGFRRITWYPDRPDVMARFRTTIEADATRFPLLLSNGNCLKREALPNGRHRAVWEDPYPKPCYLFALVAGDLACREDDFVTASGRRVTLQIFVEPKDLDKTAHAMESLKRAMRWDEEVYGREYDLDVYMIVAVSHFNMGAMENKGLNVFNTSCVLAGPATQTDKAFQRVEAVIAHEYFHNWSGNRVTCRDWFQLSLKEGFTVFRDSEFSKDMHSRAVKRIEEVNFLRTVQFPEDAGPLAHPVRPDSYVEINNFYTVTVYEKGAEVVRMLATLLGPDAFRQGCDLYFARHDGQAVTCEDFVRAMEEAGDIDLSSFRRWYSQAGTPELTVSESFDAALGEYRLRFSQRSVPMAGQPAFIAANKPFVIPVGFGLLDPETGSDLPVRCRDPRVSSRDGGSLFVLDEATTELVFTGHKMRPVPSLLRGFSAPVRLVANLADGDPAFLARHDSDAFNRWNAAQELYMRALLKGVEQVQAGKACALPEEVRQLYVVLLDEALDNTDADHALLAEMLALPAESLVADRMPVADPQAVRYARRALRQLLVAELRTPLTTARDSFASRGPWSPSPAAMARRSLAYALLDLLSESGDDELAAFVSRQYAAADNMGDQLAALRAAVHGGMANADELLTRFHTQWQHEALVIDQWFSLQAGNPAGDVLPRVRELLSHPQFELTNPNRVRSLIAAFCANAAMFHRPDGEGYRFLADQVIALDPVNPQIAARLANAFGRWRRVSVALQVHAAAAMDRILAQPALSLNTREVIHKTRFDGVP
ncbi:MAG: aminopeptidase N [Pseudomonadota bacterium]